MSKTYRALVTGKNIELYRWQVAIQYPASDNHKREEAHWASMGRPTIGESIAMGLGHIIFEDAGTHLRVFRFSSSGNLNYWQDLTPDGEWMLGSGSAYRVEDIDPIKAETKDWLPWETHRDYIERVRK